MLFNAAGYYIVYEFNRYLIKREFTSMLEHGYFDQALSKFSVFNPSGNPNFRRVDEHEIVYNGNLYDIVKEVPKGKVVTFYCIHDNKEESLIAGMNNMHHKKKALDLLQYLVTIALPVTSERPHPQETKTLAYPLLSENFAGNPVIPFSPPPEFI